MTCILYSPCVFSLSDVTDILYYYYIFIYILVYDYVAENRTRDIWTVLLALDIIIIIVITTGTWPVFASWNLRPPKKKRNDGKKGDSYATILTAETFRNSHWNWRSTWFDAPFTFNVHFIFRFSLKKSLLLYNILCDEIRGIRRGIEDFINQTENSIQNS